MMQMKSLEIKEVRQLAKSHEVISAYLVPFEHESRKKEDGSPAIWYRVVLDIKVSDITQSVAVATSRKTLRQFANISKGLEFIDAELEDGQFERISILRDIDNDYNTAISAL